MREKEIAWHRIPPGLSGMVIFKAVVNNTLDPGPFSSYHNPACHITTANPVRMVNSHGDPQQFTHSRHMAGSG